MADRDLWAEARRVRRAIENLGPRRRTTRLPEAIRARVLGYIAHGRAQGASWSALGEAVGLAATTLQRWQANAVNAGTTGALVAVSVEKDEMAFSAPGSSVILHSPTGWRVEGVDLSEAITILRALA